MVTRPIFAAMLAATMVAVATGADAAEATWLRTAFSSMPATAFGDFDGSPFLASAVSLSEARALGLRDHDTKPLDLQQRITAGKDNIRPLEAWSFRRDAALFEDRLGVPLDRLTALAGYRNLPNDTTLWIFDSDATVDAVLDGLPTRGFSPLAGGMLTNGEPSGQDMDASALGDPWRGGRVWASVVGREGRILLQAWEPDLVEAARQATPTSNLATVPFVNTVLTGAEVATGDGTKIVQALLATPAIGLSSGIPAELLTPKGTGPQAVEETRQKMEEKAAQERATGLPPYPVALLADIEAPGKSRGILVAFAYPDCGMAETGAARFAAGWRTAELQARGHGTTLEDVTQADIASRVVPAADGSCAAVVAATNPVPADSTSFENKPWAAVIRAIDQRDFGAAMIAPANPDQ